MNKLTSAVSLLALFDAASAANSDTTLCNPTAIVLRTDYPRYSQELGFGGSLLIGIRLDAHGKVATARVVRSSGKLALDQAALASARRRWRFDVSTCNAADLKREYEQSVTYAPTRGLPYSGAPNRAAARRIREAASDDRCSVVRHSYETTVTACRRADKSNEP